MKYPKIDTLWKRDLTNKYKIIEGSYTRQEFNNIVYWSVSEKVDGTNIRVYWDKVSGDIKFGGRTDSAEIPIPLLEVLQKTFTKQKMNALFADALTVVLYGEGYGGKIQSGKKYSSTEGFVLFDVLINGWWLERKNVAEIALGLGVEVAPVLPIMIIDEIIEFIKSRPRSIISDQERVMEGVVARSHPLMLFRDGTPIMFKLKVKDYED